MEFQIKKNASVETPAFKPLTKNILSRLWQKSEAGCGDTPASPLNLIL
jgi:hypothetical protein